MIEMRAAREHAKVWLSCMILDSDLYHEFPGGGSALGTVGMISICVHETVLTYNRSV